MATSAGTFAQGEVGIVSLVADASRGCVYGLSFPSAKLYRLNGDGTTTDLGRPSSFTKAAIYPGRCMWLGTSGRVYFTAGQDGGNANTGGTYDPAIYNKVWYWDPTTSTFGSQSTWTLNGRALDAKAEFFNPRVVYLMDEDFTIFKYSENASGTPSFVKVGDFKGMTDEAIGFSWSFAVRPDQVHAYVIGSNGHFFRWNFNDAASPRNFYGTIQAKDSFWADHFWFGGSCFDADGRFWVNAFHKSDDVKNARVVTIHPQTFVQAIQGAAKASTGTVKGVRHAGGLAGMWYRIVPNMPYGNAPHDAWSGCAMAPDGTIYFSAHDHQLNSGLYAVKQASSASPGGRGRFVAPATAQTVTGTYVERNESGLEATGSFTVKVESDVVVSPPDVVCRADEYTTNKNTPIDMPVLSNDDEADIVSRLVTQPANGTTTIVDAGKKIRYAPVSTFVGEKAFRYEGKRSSDGAVGEADILLKVVEPSAIARKAHNTGGTSGIGGSCRVGLGNASGAVATWRNRIGEPGALAAWPALKSGGNDNFVAMFGGDAGQKYTDYTPGSYLTSSANFNGNLTASNCRQILMVPVYPENGAVSNVEKWRQLIDDGVNATVWADGWYAFGRRIVRQCNNKRANFDFKKLVLTLGWEGPGGESYPWRVLTDEAGYILAWRVMVNRIRAGANDEQTGAGNDILIEQRFAGHRRNGNTIENCYPGDDHVDILGISAHQNVYAATGNGAEANNPHCSWRDDADYLKEKYGHRYSGDGPGFDNMLEFAKAHNKPCGFDEMDTYFVKHVLGGGAARYPEEHPPWGVMRFCRYIQEKGADIAHMCWLNAPNNILSAEAAGPSASGVVNGVTLTVRGVWEKFHRGEYTTFVYPNEPGLPP